MLVYLTVSPVRFEHRAVSAQLVADHYAHDSSHMQACYTFLQLKKFVRWMLSPKYEIFGWQKKKIPMLCGDLIPNRRSNNQYYIS